MFLKELEDVVLNEVGLNAVFECEISRTDLKAEWYRGEKLIRRSDKYNMTSEGGKHTLTVEKSEPDDVGEYTVKLNGVSSKAKLIIKGKITLGSSMFTFSIENKLFPLSWNEIFYLTQLPGM